MTTATTVISINRPPVARAKDVTGFYVGKSRSSETGVVFMAQSNFACSRTHWPTTDCQEFKLYGAASERVEDLLKGMEKLEDQQEAEGSMRTVKEEAEAA